MTNADHAGTLSRFGCQLHHDDQDVGAGSAGAVTRVGVDLMPAAGMLRFPSLGLSFRLEDQPPPRSLQTKSDTALVYTGKILLLVGAQNCCWAATKLRQ